MIGERRAKIPSMTQFYDLDAANAAVPELDRIMTALGDQRAELIRLRDEVLTRGGGSEGTSTAVEATCG